MSGYDKLVEQLNSSVRRYRMRRVVGWAIIFFVFATIFVASAMLMSWRLASLVWGFTLGLMALLLFATRLIDY